MVLLIIHEYCVDFLQNCLHPQGALLHEVQKWHKSVKKEALGYFSFVLQRIMGF